jgi:hypothetical protein
LKEKGGSKGSNGFQNSVDGNPQFEQSNVIAAPAI